MTLNGSYEPQQVQRKRIRRSKFEIWAELLEACARTARTQSWLLRKVGLKTSAIKEALDFLVTANLIEQLPTSDSDLREFRTTEKGEEALTQYYNLVTKYFLTIPSK
ncbi:MAG: winged helix-turn-helix domain-containing protein [Candidatus Heimdallarchaeota archaeon]